MENTEITKEFEQMVQKVRAAQELYASFSQSDVDRVFKAAAIAANMARIDLAEMAFSETGMGVMEDKIIKNHFASEYIYNKYKNSKTCGMTYQDTSAGARIVVAPLGVIAGIIPTTNPTSTTIFKALIALKTRNAIIFSPHPKAKKSTVAAAKLILDAAVVAGAPKNIIGWIDEPSLELTNALMRHPMVDVILATGGPGMVNAAYTSGTPALGVGAGNTPAVIDESADIIMAVSSILLSKTFDNGMICASEQAIVAVKPVYEDIKKEFSYRGAYIVSEDEIKALRKVITTPENIINPKIVGRSAAVIAAMAGLKIPDDTKILLVEQTDYADNNPFAHEKLAPVLTLYKADDFEKAVDIAYQLVFIGGLGHTSVLYTNPKNQDRIDYFSEKLPTGRVLINSPSSQGGIGDLYNFYLEPSLTLGCGSWGGNSISENVGIKHLLNYKTVAERRDNMLWYRIPQKIYFKRGSTDSALREYIGKKRALIITDNFLFQSGMLDSVIATLNNIDVGYQVFYDVEPDPSLTTVYNMLKIANSYNPDLIIAIGGGSPMDAAKILWLMYEYPETDFAEISMRFMDIRKRICSIPTLGAKADLVAIPTTSGTGSEVTPFSIITDTNTHTKYAVADYSLTPSMAIIDPNFVDNMPKSLTATSGIDVLVHATEAYVSTMASPFTNAPALEAIKKVFAYLPRSYKNGAADPEAREEMHYAATIAGMAFANAFLGLCHSMAHKLGGAFNIPHGIANALLLCQIIKFNATDCPKKQAAFPQYKAPDAKRRYGEIAECLCLSGKTDDDKVSAYLKVIEGLKKDLDIPLSIKDWGVDEKDFMKKLNSLARLAYDDQCTGANPVYPLLEDIKAIYLNAYHGKI